MPLHLFQGDANCRIDNNRVWNPDYLRKSVGLFKGSQHTLVLWNWLGMRHQARNIDSTQSSFWTCVRHNWFMKYTSNKVHGKFMHKALTEGTATPAWMPRGLLGCPGVHNTYSVSNKIHQNTYLHSVQEEFYETFSDFNHDDQGTKFLWIILFRFQCLEWREGPVNDIGFRFGVEDFCNRLLQPKCHNVVTIDCFHSTMRPCHYVWQPNSTKSSFVWNVSKMTKKQGFAHTKANVLLYQMKSNDFRAFINRTVSSVTRYFGPMWFVDTKSSVT